MKAIIYIHGKGGTKEEAKHYEVLFPKYKVFGFDYKSQTPWNAETEFGETLSWEYLSWIRKHPIKWNTPTRILYGQNDTLQSFETISSFSKEIGAELFVMENGEHWFHTEEQMAFLDKWIRR